MFNILFYILLGVYFGQEYRLPSIKENVKAIIYKEKEENKNDENENEIGENENEIGEQEIYIYNKYIKYVYKLFNKNN